MQALVYQVQTARKGFACGLSFLPLTMFGAREQAKRAQKGGMTAIQIRAAQKQLPVINKQVIDG